MVQSIFWVNHIQPELQLTQALAINVRMAVSNFRTGRMGRMIFSSVKANSRMHQNRMFRVSSRLAMTPVITGGITVAPGYFLLFSFIIQLVVVLVAGPEWPSAQWCTQCLQLRHRVTGRSPAWPGPAASARC